MLLRKFQRVIGTEFLIIRVLFGSVVFKAGVMLKGFLFFYFLFFIYHKQLFYCMEIATTKEDDKYFQ